MAERDRFELDVAEALRAYVDDAPTTVQPDEVVRRLAATRPRRATTFGPWRLALSPAMALLLLLGALLLAALGIGAGALILRSTNLSVLPVPAVTPAPVAACPPGTNPNEPGPPDQARPPWAYVQPMAFDSSAGRIVAHATETWTFDVCTNRWQQMRPAVEAPNVRSTLVYDADADRTVALADDGRVWAYDLAGNTWVRKGPVPAGVLDFTRLIYDPVSGLVIAQPASGGRPIEMWTYAVETDTWTRIEAHGAPDKHERQIMAYDRSIDRVIVYDGELPGTWLFDPRTGAWMTSTADNTPEMGFDWAVAGGEIAYDEATRQVVAFSGGKVVAYDGRSARWSVLLDPRAAGVFVGRTLIGRPTVVYDSVNTRLVVYGSEYPEADQVWIQPSDVVALDPATSTWTTLLAAETP